MKQSKSLALMVCYIGKFPWYFKYFVHSCKYNPTVDFIILTDDDTYRGPLPENVKLIFTTLEEISAIATEKLGLPVQITFAYKLNGFKPAYGLMFPDILRDYDWWGYIDIDIILGDIRNFITDELLYNYELICPKPDWIPGCFLLFKNNNKMNSLFNHSKDHEKIFTSEKYYNFDETNFSQDYFSYGLTYLEVKTEIESMMHVIKKLESVSYIKPYFDLHMVDGNPGKLKCISGKMYYSNKFEVILYHLIKLKLNYTLKTNLTAVPDSFMISPTRIYHNKERTGVQ